MNEWQRLEKSRAILTRQQYKTIKGQMRAGDMDGAMRGLDKLCGGEDVSKRNRQSERSRQRPSSQRKPGAKARLTSG